MSTEKMREEFEAWVEANFGLSVRRNPAGAYQSFGVYAAWEAWQASRAAWTCPYQTGHQLPVKLMLLPSA
ncbi:hypothetical protein [Pseudomonas typographi]|uniref:Uncharacterized protein n=1 Tax=Pseudomonas typographi TaxID=2715964 RepID=A0ABR7ZB78_9PSED|nr:hypothetical protein [Pseudomonas typographi]MBD1602558.1 hypothetical protein [Pseudomonas typographi]